MVENDSVVDAITDRSAAHSLTVLGATRQGLLQQLVFGVIPEQIAEQAQSTVILTKRNPPVASWLRNTLEQLVR